MARQESQQHPFLIPGQPRVLYVATTNAGKLRDFQQATLEHSGLSLETLPGIAHIPAPVEDADTFEGNARLKAAAYSLHLPGEIVLADDSGLAVDALDGAPGVYSARYAAREDFHSSQAIGTDALNNICLLDRLANTPAAVTASARTARYHCVLAAARDGEVIAIGIGTVEGFVLTAPRGSAGFGYDPLFFLPSLDRTMAEIDPVTRLKLSHRGRALTALLDALLVTESGRMLSPATRK